MNERPTSLKIVCGVWFVVGALELLQCALGFYQLIGMQISGASSTYPAEMSAMVPFVVAGGYALTLFRTVIGLLITVSAIYLWKLRSWARTSLEVVSWVGLLLVTGIGVFSMYVFLEMTSHASSAARDQFDWMGWIVLAFFGTLSIAHGISIGVLRGRKVRDAIAAARIDESGVAEHPLPYQVPSLPGA